MPTAAQALLLVAGVAALSFYVGRTLAARHAVVGLIIAEWGVILLPALAFVLLGRYDVRRTLALRAATRRHLAGGLLLIAGGLPAAWFLAWLQSFWLALPEEMLRAMEALMREQAGRLPLLLFAFAVTPAICEEVVFRGVLLSSSREAMPARHAILLNALVFGAFHVSNETIFRLLPTAWLGLLLAFAAWRSRSIWVSAAMHAANNGSIALLAAYPALAAMLGVQGDGAPPLWLAPLAIAAMIAGWRLLSPPSGGARP